MNKRFFNAKNKLFKPRPLQKCSVLINDVFIDLAGPKKAAPIVDNLGGSF